MGLNISCFSIVLGIGVTLVAELILYFLIRKIEQPKLLVATDMWRQKKWVGESPQKKFYSTSEGSEISSVGSDFVFYGIRIENKHRGILRRTSAEIGNTTITVFDTDGNQVIEKRECRWWTHTLAEAENLFVPDNIDINKRRTEYISDSVSKDLVIAYIPNGRPSPYLFSIDSDRRGRFISNQDRFKGLPPYYAIIEISGKNIHTKIKLCITPIKNNTDLSILEVDKFPFHF